MSTEAKSTEARMLETASAIRHIPTADQPNVPALVVDPELGALRALHRALAELKAADFIRLTVMMVGGQAVHEAFVNSERLAINKRAREGKVS